MIIFNIRHVYDKKVTDLIEFLGNPNQYDELVLQQYEIGEDEIGPITNILQTTSFLKSLTLDTRNNGIKVSEIKKLTDALIENNSLL